MDRKRELRKKAKNVFEKKLFKKMQFLEKLLKMQEVIEILICNIRNKEVVYLFRERRQKFLSCVLGKQKENGESKASVLTLYSDVLIFYLLKDTKSDQIKADQKTFNHLWSCLTRKVYSSKNTPFCSLPSFFVLSPFSTKFFWRPSLNICTTGIETTLNVFSFIDSFIISF